MVEERIPRREGSGERDLLRLLREHPVRVRRLARACGSRCEHCGFTFLPGLLSVHVLAPQVSRKSFPSNPEESLLVLCPACAPLFSSGAVKLEEMRILAGLRAKETSRAMREILVQESRPYTPPVGRDFAEIFEEMVTGGALDLCLNGG